MADITQTDIADISQTDIADISQTDMADISQADMTDISQTDMVQSFHRQNGIDILLTDIMDRYGRHFIDRYGRHFIDRYDRHFIDRYGIDISQTKWYRQTFHGQILYIHFMDRYGRDFIDRQVFLSRYFLNMLKHTFHGQTQEDIVLHWITNSVSLSVNQSFMGVSFY